MSDANASAFDKVAVVDDGLRGNKVAVQLRGMGVETAGGKFSKTFGFTGHVAGEPDKPLSTLAAPLIDGILSLARYSDEAALRADLEAFKAYVGSLESAARPKEGGTP